MLQQSKTSRRSSFYLATVVLPRWFAAPIIVSSVILGWAVSAPLSWWVVLPVLMALLVMSYSHVINAVLDWSWTKLDRGLESERSHPKPYTSGQQVIASGLLSPRQVLLIAVGWLALSAIAMIYISIYTASFWVPRFWVLSTLVTFAYSWGKLHWLCELALGIGFGPLAALIGAAASPSPDYLTAALASIPIFLIFGFAAEIWDQAADSDANWERGLRNIGALAWHYHIFIWEPVLAFTVLAYLSQLFLVLNGVLNPWTWLTLGTLPFLAFIPRATLENKLATLVALTGVFVYCILLALGEVIATV